VELQAPAADGTIALSHGDKKYVIDANEGKVRVQYEGKALTADKFTFELPSLELRQSE
jgi:hypothetical protein